jgi:hypothetical protein
MSTYLEVQTQIADELDDEDLLSGGQIAKAINSAIKEYRDKRFWFNQVKAKSFTLTASTEYIAPTLVVAGISTVEPLTTVDMMRIDDGTGANYTSLIQVDDTVINEAQSGSVIARPTHFSLVSDASGTRIRFFPIPDQTYTPTVTGLIRFADLAADGDTNSWLTDGEELIRLAAKRKVMSEVTKEIPSGSPPSPAEQKALSDLYATTRLRRGSPQVRTEVAGMQGNNYGVIADIRFG